MRSPYMRWPLAARAVMPPGMCRTAQPYRALLVLGSAALLSTHHYGNSSTPHFRSNPNQHAATTQTFRPRLHAYVNLQPLLSHQSCHGATMPFPARAPAASASTSYWRQYYFRPQRPAPKSPPNSSLPVIACYMHIRVLAVCKDGLCACSKHHTAVTPAMQVRFSFC